MAIMARLYRADSSRETHWDGRRNLPSSAMLEKVPEEGETIVLIGPYGIRTSYEVLAVQEHEALLMQVPLE